MAAHAVVKALSSATDNDALMALDAIQAMEGGRAKGPGLMDSINNMRCEVCWARPNIKEHKKCMGFLTKTCHRNSEGKFDVCEEVCDQFLAELVESCHEGEEEYCGIYEELAGEEVPAPEGEGLDEDGDGIADDEDSDRDGDEHKNEEDAFPHDQAEWKDTDGDGVGDNGDPDRDGDDIVNDADAFSDDPNESADSDGDGVGDHADATPNGEVEPPAAAVPPVPPAPPAAVLAPAPAVAAPGGAPGDRDGDANGDAYDAFPDDPKESLDSDGDGYGDASDPWPRNPNCYHAGLPCEEEEEEEEPYVLTPAQEQMVDPRSLNKIGQGLPVEGYDEYSSELSAHEDGSTATSDWGEEFGIWNGKSQVDSIEKICKEHPNNAWCQKRKKYRTFSR